jgi:hypothetical protein
MLTDDELDRMLRDSDPDPGGPATDPDAPIAVRILARVRGRARQRRRRILVLAPVVALTVAGVTAGTYAWVAGDGKGHTLDSNALDCRGSAHADAVIHFEVATDDPVRSCRQQWQGLFGHPAPDTLTACVDSSSQGSIVVYPGGREVCARHRADPYTGPTQEQLHLSAFRVGIKSELAGRTCVPYPEFRRVVERILADHDLTGWKTRDFQTAEKEPEGACAEISYYDEPNRTIVIGDHLAGTPIIWT